MHQKLDAISDRTSAAALIPAGEGSLVHSDLQIVTRFVSADFSTDETLAQALGTIRQILGACGAALLWLGTGDSDRAVIRALDKGDTWGTERRVALGEGILAQAIRTGETLLQELEAGDLPGEQWFGDLADLAGGRARAVLCAPLVTGDERLGAVLLFGEKKWRCDRQDADRLDALAGWLVGQVAQALQLRRLEAAVAELEARRRELLHSRDTLRALFDSVPTSMYIVDRQYRLAAINRSRAALTGQAPRQLVSRRCFEALFQRKDACPGCRVEETFALGSRTQRLERRAANGAIEYEISSFPIQDQAGIISQAILFEEDVTEKLRLQASLAQSEKLAAIGQLAAGVAHEINNPLTAIIANAQLLGRSMAGGDEDQREMADLILQAGQRASQVVGELLDLARKDSAERAPVDINATLRKASALLQHRLAGRSIQVAFDQQAGLPPVLGSPDQLLGVWLNLLGNAIDAISDSQGTIRIMTCREESLARINITDSGPGIPAEELAHIFEPFYTTKPPGQGTGLGLPVCHSIVRQYGGEMRVESRAGAGTTFTVLLPLLGDSI